MLKVTCLPGLPTCLPMYCTYSAECMWLSISAATADLRATYGDRDLDFAEDYLFSPARAKQYASIY